MPSGLCVNVLVPFPRGNFSYLANCVREDMIESTISPGRICFFFGLFPIWLKTLFFARQNMICCGHLQPLCTWAITLHIDSKTPLLFHVADCLNHYPLHFSLSRHKKEKLRKKSTPSRRLLLALASPGIIHCLTPHCYIPLTSLFLLDLYIFIVSSAFMSMHAGL